MAALGNLMQIMVLLLLGFGTWNLSRSAGITGLLGAQLLAIPGFWLIGFIALATGIWADYDGLEVFGLVLWAFLFNCLMLPLAGFALWRRRAAAA